MLLFDISKPEASRREESAKTSAKAEAEANEAIVIATASAQTTQNRGASGVKARAQGARAGVGSRASKVNCPSPKWY